MKNNININNRVNVQRNEKKQTDGLNELSICEHEHIRFRWICECIIMYIMWSFSSQFNQIFGIYFIELYYHIFTLDLEVDTKNKNEMKKKRKKYDEEGKKIKI